MQCFFLCVSHFEFYRMDLFSLNFSLHDVLVIVPDRIFWFCELFCWRYRMGLSFSTDQSFPVSPPPFPTPATGAVATMTGTMMDDHHALESQRPPPFYHNGEGGRIKSNSETRRVPFVI